MYEKYIRSNPALLESLHELVGKTLWCFCKPHACHGDIIVKIMHERWLM
jgi:hypothetical protein